MTRDKLCGLVTEKDENKKLTLSGWVQYRRDHGGVIFIDLRDYTGFVQVVFNPDQPELFKIAEKLRSEAVISVSGTVLKRSDATINNNIPTGKVEVVADTVTLHSLAQSLPFSIDDHQQASEETRLKSRFLDLRRPQMQRAIRMRAKVNSLLRHFLESKEFIEIETPYLTKPTPEGARDYIVPSRTQQGHCYALPQSPQILKQILMVSGFDKYYQIVRCFRDEDLRADRQPEFTQLDVEMSFVDEQHVRDVAESLIFKTCQELGIELPSPFPVMPYQEAMDDYGSDKPDLRNPLKLIVINDALKDCGFKVFSAPAKANGQRVVVLRVPNATTQLTRKKIDEYTHAVGKFGAKGLAYIKVNQIDDLENGLQSPITKFLSKDELTAILKASNAANNDILFFGAGDDTTVCQSMGYLRNQIGQDLNLLSEEYKPLWVVDWPLFEETNSQGQTTINSCHHPFTAPCCDDIDTLKKEFKTIKSKAYDLVLNGSEILGGSIRIHDLQMQYAIMEILGFDKKQTDTQFGHLTNALSYGAPPHGGFALGIDRFVAILCQADSIRDVIAFPKTQNARCLLTDAPAKPDVNQYIELGLSVQNKSES